ncbi:MAG: ribose 5-phosphate isomerase B [Nitrospiria bacterium]
MKISVASDHAGFKFKKHILQYLSEHKIESIDLGTDNHSSVDYPDYAIKVATQISTGVVDRGILICGTGIGMSIVANKFTGVRAALCHNMMMAEASRRHNDANILVLGGRILSDDEVISIVKVWLDTAFDGGRHHERIEKIKAIEKAHGVATDISLKSQEQLEKS